MTSSRLHVPPPGFGDASEIVSMLPVDSSIFFSLRSAKNATNLLSGDQNGSDAPSVPGTALSSDRSNGRSHRAGLGLLGPGASYTSFDPSGDIASVLDGATPPGGNAIEKRI